MKKSLIALAALAAFGTASAQSTVAITGTFNAAFQKATTGATSADLVDSNLVFTAVEDLGGGLKATASSAFQANGRQDITSTNAVTSSAVANQAKKDGVYGRNAFVALSGGFGAVSIGRLEGTNTTEKALPSQIWLSSGFDRAHLLGAKANYQVTSYTAPAISGFTVGFSRSTLLDANFAPASGTANAELVIDTLSASYANGPLTVDFANKSVENGTTSKGTKNELAVTYTIAALKLGAGVTTHSGAYYTASTTVTGNNTLLSASYAVTPTLTVAAAMVNRADGAGVTDAKGRALSAEYALSKRTQLNATVGKMEKAGDAANNFNQYRVGVKHAF